MHFLTHTQDTNVTEAANSGRSRGSRALSAIAAGLVLVGLGAGGCSGDDAASDSDATSETSGDTSTGTDSTSTSTTGGETSGDTTTTGGETTGDTTTTGGETTGGTTGETTGDTTGTTTTGDTTGGASYTVSGTITRSADVKFTKGADGIGDLNIALVSECSMNPPPTELYGFVEAADLSSADNAIPYDVADVPVGTHYMIAFLDDNDSGDLDSGDLVASDGLGIKCTEVTVVDADIEGADLELNFVLP
jgi:hypothetical protein